MSGRWCAVAAAVLLAGGCQTTPHDRVGDGVAVEHVIICWLKEPGDTTARGRIIEASKRLAAIPGAVRVSTGPVLSGRSARPQEDRSFDVGVVMTFRDRAALRDYQLHPLHQQAVRDVLVPLVREFKAYDFVSQ